MFLWSYIAPLTSSAPLIASCLRLDLEIQLRSLQQITENYLSIRNVVLSSSRWIQAKFVADLSCITSIALLSGLVRKSIARTTSLSVV